MVRALEVYTSTNMERAYESFIDKLTETINKNTKTVKVKRNQFERNII